MDKNPAGPDEAEMIAESRLDYLLDAIEAPEPPEALRTRLYELAAGARHTPVWQRIAAWFAAGPMSRPAGGMAALACSLLIGIALGTALPDRATPDAARPLPVIALPTASEPPLVVAGLFENPLDGINLVAPPASQPAAAEPDTPGAPAEEDGVGGLPLY